MKQLWQHILLLFLLLIPCTGQAQDSENNIDARKRAVDYFHLESTSLLEQERYDEAFELLVHCLSIDTTSSAIKYFLAPYYSVLGNDSIACSMLEEIVRRNPDNEAYNDALVNQYARTGNWKAAIEVYERIIDSAHSKSEIYKSLYALYENDGNFEKALEILDRIESLEGKTSIVTGERIQQYMNLYRYDDVITLVKQNITENPDDTRYVTFLGEVYVLMGEFTLAESTFQSVLESSPEDVPSLKGLINLYAQTEDEESLCTVMERLIKGERTDTETRLANLVSYILYKEGCDSTYIKPFFQELLQLPHDRLAIHESYADYLEYKKADASELIPVYEKIVELDSENVSAIIALLQYAIDAEDSEAVIKYADDALLYLPHRLELYYYKALSNYVLGKKRECIDISLEGLKKRDSDISLDVVSTVFTMLGNTYHELEMTKEASWAYDSALVYEPGNIEALNNYSYFLSLDGKDLLRALEMSQKTIVADPENQTHLDTYAWILFKLKRYEEAKAYAEKIISLNEEMGSVVLHHIGDILAKCGDIDKAVEYWKRAREAGDSSKILDKKIRKRKYYNGAKF